MLHGPETTPRDYGPLAVANDVTLMTRSWTIRGIRLTWLRCIRWILRNRPDVMILQDGVSILSNYAVYLLSRIMGFKIISYSHGHNHQAGFTRSRFVKQLSETLRRFLLNMSHALIVYTPANADYLQRHGVRTRIFVSHNTLDTNNREEWYAKIDATTVQEVKRSVGAGDGEHVITFLGRLVPEKRIPLFIDTIRQLQLQSPGNYVGFMLGEGPLLSDFKTYAGDLPIFFLGYCREHMLARFLASSDCVFLPCQAGLAVVEAFCASKPFITCRRQHHGPEIDYVSHDVNGLLLDTTDPAEIAREIAKLVEDRHRLFQMSMRARRTADTLSPEVSIRAFEDAITYVTRFS